MQTYIWEHKLGPLHVIQIAVLQDNYSYLLHDSETGSTAALDPAADPKITAELKRRRWALHAIWNTHWHADHCGGNRSLLRYAHATAAGPIEVAAYKRGKIPGCNHELRQGAVLQLGALAFQVYEVPGHTLDHLLFAFQNEAGDNAIFCGDTLFSLGCGRLFEGTAAQLEYSLSQIARLPEPEQTLVFCGHEYTRSNLRFALAVEPENPALQQLTEQLTLPEYQSLATVPSKLAFELKANPFLRVGQEEFCRRLATRQPLWKDWQDWSTAERLGKLRRMKDHFA